ncbi:DUF1648 domain-containing protein [Paenibacillus sp. GSMTC-2017]|uniref:DUF1648 domain-containing protein n=1 Tax=Paenibacillus sp. GSMTC-2017 TaxID=2794350 RepID=UPI0018D7714B|nr:DUF5808 domain-containing protein [Paenibacillus sp. GSMTC-2017]MBH5318985.1 DUF1648 domain-containing protein [Paenibacillus sp. GSMTC-2017]
MSNGMMLLLVFVLMVPITFIMTVMPFLTRKIESFGVTIPEEAQKDSKITALRFQYLWLNGGIGAVITASLLWFSNKTVSEQQWGIMLVSHVLGYLLLSFVIYLKQHYSVKHLKEQKGWLTSSVQRVMINTKFRNAKLTVSYFWFIPHVLLILATILIGVLNFDQFPEQIPMKYGLDGEVSRSVERSYMAVLWPALIQALLLIVFILINFSISRSKQIVEASDPEGSLMRNAIFRRYWSVYIIITGLLMAVMFGFIEIGMLLEWGSNEVTFITLVASGIVVIYAIVLSVITGQGGSRIKIEGVSKAQTMPMGDQDQYWKLGQIYFNPQDPSVFVEKRFGVGWSINFGRPMGWIIILVPLALIPLLIFVIESYI